jgi:hypothetical protein
MAFWLPVSAVRWRKVPAGPGEGAHVQPLQLVAHAGRGAAGGGLDQADEQQRQPAQQHVGADAVLAPVIDRPQVEELLHVPPAALDGDQLLVAQCDVLGARLRVGAVQQELAVQLGFGGDRLGVEAQQSAGCDLQVAVQAGLGGELSAQLGPLGSREPFGAGDQLAQGGDQPLANLLVPLDSLGVKAPRRSGNAGRGPRFRTLSGTARSGRWPWRCSTSWPAGG